MPDATSMLVTGAEKRECFRATAAAISRGPRFGDDPGADTAVVRHFRPHAARLPDCVCVGQLHRVHWVRTYTSSFRLATMHVEADAVFRQVHARGSARTKLVRHAQ